MYYLEYEYMLTGAWVFYQGWVKEVQCGYYFPISADFHSPTEGDLLHAIFCEPVNL